MTEGHKMGARSRRKDGWYATFPLTPYPVTLLVCVGMPYQKMLMVVQPFNQTPLTLEEQASLQLHTMAKTMRLNNGHIVMQLSTLTHKVSDLTNLVHETFHVVDFLFDRIGLSLTLASDEAYAYLLSSVFQRIFIASDAHQ